MFVRPEAKIQTEAPFFPKASSVGMGMPPCLGSIHLPLIPPVGQAGLIVPGKEACTGAQMDADCWAGIPA